MTNFSIKTTRTGERQFGLSRINVFLGANGTGKSQLLQQLKGQSSSFLPEYSVVYIEGGRAIQMVDSLELTPQNFSNYRTLTQTLNTYRGKRSNTTFNRVFDALKSLEELGNDAYKQHSISVTAWDDAGRKGDPPRRPIDPMARVFEAFNDIFPRIRLELQSDNRRLICRKDGAQYHPTQLSDGEKQVFSILADMVELTEDRSVLFVDEPELNLNPGLANRLWESVESILPNSVFIYATHSVSFARRPSVEHVLVVGHDSDNIEKVSGLEELSFAEQEELLGSLPKLVANTNTLVVEGYDESFDAIFYRWLLTDSDISPAAVGGSEDVVAIVSRSGKWQRISPQVNLLGVIDRDYKSDDELSSTAKNGVLVLDLHEAEAYLCVPKIFVRIARCIGMVEDLPTEENISKKILEYLKENLLEICARRASTRLSLHLRPSVSSNAARKITSYEGLEQLFLHDVEQQMSVASDRLAVENAKVILGEEYGRLTTALENQDIISALRLAPGKQLLNQLLVLAGARDANGVARAARQHLNINDFEHLKLLKETLEDACSKFKSK